MRKLTFYRWAALGLTVGALQGAGCSPTEEEVDATTSALTQKAIAVPHDMIPNAMYFLLGSHKSPQYPTCGTTNCTNDFWRTPGCNPMAPSDDCLDLNSATGDYAYIYADTRPFSNCGPGACQLYFAQQSMQSQMSASAWRSIVAIDKVVIYMTISLNTANTEDLEFIYLTTDVAQYVEMPTIPADGLGHKIKLTLNKRPSNPGQPETNWTKSVLADGFVTNWMIGNEQEVSVNRPGGIFVQSFTEVVYYH